MNSVLWKENSVVDKINCALIKKCCLPNCSHRQAMTIDINLNNVILN